ncbi:hypothetical protein AZI86_12835 [Bdellovibrio bacteriovorus]|uniref:Fatty acid desaturase domain-containing protein n=1 Tax=Bdellovibrio bacteriovorus TaxID=959 RepID=A0A150WIY3_BDEBC|nr:fatty acid desaturase family protein [Bdellovibrio bacteriovorus]KYG63709.1 hypothetical protein AZI86_12835 [Bdellovibrio bacteriovorus]
MSALPKTTPVAEHASSVNSHVIQLSKLSFVQGIKPLVFDWATIGCAMLVANQFSSLWTYIIAAIVIASRQHALLVLSHEGAHFRLAKSHALNNFISDTFAAFPIFFCTTTYRAHHLKHHRYLNTMQDPDWARKASLPEWTFPQTRMQLWKTMFKILITGWFKMILLFASLSGVFSKNTYTSKSALLLLGKKILFYSTVAVVTYSLHLGYELFVYWIVPYLVVMPVIERIRSISEHFALSYKDDFNQTRDILCSPLEAFLFGPHHIRYHLSHHLYPSVPQYNLPKLHHELLQTPEFAASAHQNDAYFFFGEKTLLEDLTKKSGSHHE